MTLLQIQTQAGSDQLQGFLIGFIITVIIAVLIIVYLIKRNSELKAEKDLAITRHMQQDARNSQRKKADERAIKMLGKSQAEHQRQREDNLKTMRNLAVRASLNSKFRNRIG